VFLTDPHVHVGQAVPGFAEVVKEESHMKWFDSVCKVLKHPGAF
jgi:hypothetical protein